MSKYIGNVNVNSLTGSNGGESKNSYAHITSIISEETYVEKNDNAYPSMQILYCLKVADVTKYMTVC
jgi:hypothetical protein